MIKRREDDPSNWDMTPRLRSTCPADDELAAWLDGDLTAESRALVEEHLAGCGDCRSVVADAAGALETYAAPRGRRRYIAGGTAAAVAAAVLVLVLVRPHATLQDPPPVRTTSGATAPEDMQRIDVREPIQDAVLHADMLRFVWAELEPGTVYQLTLSDESGAVLWRTRTGDASAEPPPEIATALRPGVPYYWRVEALLPDLRSAGSTASRFQLRRP